MFSDRLLDELRIDPFDRTKEVHLADVDAVVAENRVDHRDMEIDVWDRHLQQVSPPSTLPGAQERLTFLPAAPAYCASFTLSANATVFQMRARTSSIVCSLSSCLGGVCPESQAAAALT